MHSRMILASSGAKQGNGLETTEAYSTVYNNLLY